MKKLLAVLLAVIMVLGLAACKPGDSGDKNKNKGEISVLYYSFSDAYISTVRTAMDKILTDGGYTFNDYDADRAGSDRSCKGLLDAYRQRC